MIHQSLLMMPHSVREKKESAEKGGERQRERKRERERVRQR